VTTTINIDHPLFNTRSERQRIQAVLRHLGSGADLRDFPASASEKVALVKTANQRGLIAWHKARGRYELTPAGWCELAPSRRFGVGSMMVGTTLGATVGAAALAVFWFTAGAAHGPAAPRPVVAAAPVTKAPAPAVTGSVSNAGPSASTPTTAATPAPAPTAPAPVPAAAAAPIPAPAPAAAPVEPEPTKVALEPTPEQLAEVAAKAKQAARKEKARQRAAAARRKREEAARAWAGDPWRARQAEYSGHGVYSYGGGGQNSWFAYR
jgi:outer membrane biosynthesis protein TonB